MRILCTILALFTLSSSALGEVVSNKICLNVLPDGSEVHLRATVFGTIAANSIPVSSPDQYSVMQILKNLGLSDPQFPNSNTIYEIDELRLRSERHNNFLSLGEGMSGLVPHLRRMYSANAIGLDVWYHDDNVPNNEMGHKMVEHVNEHGDYLIQGSAANIPAAIPSNSQDYVVGHMLLNNIREAEEDLMISIIEEAIRVAKPRATIRFAGVHSSHNLGWLKDYLQKKYPGLQVSVSEITFDRIVGGISKPYTTRLLSIDNPPLSAE